MRLGTYMKLYFSPLSCSLASRIAIYEAALDAETTFHRVTLSTKRYDEDHDYWQVTSIGQVPALVTRDGSLLTENAAVLQYVADLAPSARLAPPPADRARYDLQHWLSFIGTELHKLVFATIYSPQTPPEAKAFAQDKMLPNRLGVLSRKIEGKDYLVGDAFTVADAYLYTALNWASAKTDLTKWPAISAYHRRMQARAHVRRAFGEERALLDGAA
jgi:glutathione S-transferase